ncbi:MAG: phosphatase PAP2 family protein [Treponema sp.]|jgi:membrane-associated phospholipid phosphatase|nr:phosphatase PAP2 family protein [Treponema sp.]
MESVLQWGLDFIRFVQKCASPELTVIMRIITEFGGAAMYLTVIPLIYWCVDEKKALRFDVAVLISIWVNITLKFLLDQPRPFFAGYDPSVGIVIERMGGLPSGHAQTSLVLFVIIASWIKKKWATAAAAVICLLISFSRIYLGVHFPTDIFGGWILGGAILCGYFLLSGKIEALLVKGGFRAGMIACAFLSFVMILYLPSVELLMPGGTLLGMGAGYCLNRRYVGFMSADYIDRIGILQRSFPNIAKYLILLVRFLLGITGLVLIFIAVGKLIPQMSHADHIYANRNLFGFIRFALAGLWVSVGAPWVFVRLRLAGQQKEQ